MKKFNYCVASYWREDCNHKRDQSWYDKQYEDSIGLYTYGCDHFYGTLKEAKQLKKFVEKKSPDKNWHIFQIIEVPE